MLGPSVILEEAQKLHSAERDRKQMAAVTTRYPDMQIEDAYAIQAAWMDLKKSEGRKVVGYKIGLTSRVMQVSMNIDEPDYGTLLNDMVFANRSTIQASDFLDPRIEVELAFILKDRLFGSNLSIADVLQATDYVSPALELIAARSYRKDPSTGYTRTVKDTISDNAANAGIILGDKKMKVEDFDMRWVGALMYKNGIIEESGVSAAVLDHPALGVAWLAKKYSQHGIALEPSQILLAGSFTRPIIVKAGDKIDVDYNHLGKVSCNFV